MRCGAPSGGALQRQHLMRSHRARARRWPSTSCGRWACFRKNGALARSYRVTCQMSQADCAPAMRRRTPNEAVSIEQLRALGVLSWHLDTTDLEADPKLAAIRAARGYSYHVRAACFFHTVVSCHNLDRRQHERVFFGFMAPVQGGRSVSNTRRHPRCCAFLHSLSSAATLTHCRTSSRCHLRSCQGTSKRSSPFSRCALPESMLSVETSSTSRASPFAQRAVNVPSARMQEEDMQNDTSKP